MRLSDKLTEYAAELTAIRIALEWVIGQGLGESVMGGSRDIVILTDSISSVQSLETKTSHSRPKRNK